jgi:hypothetical protein
MNLILEKSKFVEHYTYLDPIFDTAPEFAEFTYLISDLAILSPNSFTDTKLSDNPLVISGRVLRDIVQKDKIQFVWAVLSGFDREPIIPSELPYADGNPNFWQGVPTPQIPEAQFEIVCWDSGATLFIGIDSLVAEKLRRKYPDILDLDEENQRTANYRL